MQDSAGNGEMWWTLTVGTVLVLLCTADNDEMQYGGGIVFVLVSGGSRDSAGKGKM